MTVVRNTTDYNYKMDVNDKQTYAVLKRDPTPALQRNLNNKLKLENPQGRLSALQQTDM